MFFLKKIWFFAPDLYFLKKKFCFLLYFFKKIILKKREEVALVLVSLQKHSLEETIISIKKLNPSFNSV